ncbi:hypothetical protein G6F71_003586 [Rhizopus microsporus]|nr:hypothetical protein G6F71_003586 [Rhizopus microsporus]
MLTKGLIPVSSADSDFAGLNQKTKLIIWDEVPMQHKHCFEAVHRILQGTCDDPDEPYLFGGKSVVLGSDFAQIPPVIRRGNRADTVSASIRQSLLWPRLQLLRLTHNMRLTSLQNENDIAFARFLADILQGNIVLPSFIHQTNNLAEFISRIYGDQDIQRLDLNSQVYFGERTILACRNDRVDAINMVALENMPGEKVTLLSTDSADINDADGLHTIPAEYLQSLNPSDLHPSQLELLAASTHLQNYQRIHNFYCQAKWSQKLKFKTYINK